MTAPRRSRRGRIALLSLLLLLVAALLGARWYFSGPRLASFLNRVLFRGKIQGRVEIESIDWPFSALGGRRIPATVTGLRIYDRHGHLTLWIPKATATCDWLTAALYPHDVIIDDLEVDGGWAFIEEEETRDPARPYDVSFTSVFQPLIFDARPQGMRHDQPGPIIQVRSMHLANLNVMLKMRAWSAYLFGVETDGVLRQSFREPALMDFSFAIAPTIKAASTSFARMHFDLVDVVLNRFGQYPQARDTLEFSARATTLLGARVRVAGKLLHIYEKDPWKAAVDLEVDARDAAGEAAWLSRFWFTSGRPAGHLTLTGPLPSVRMDWSARGLPWVYAPIVVDHTAGTMALPTLEVELQETELRGLGGRALLRGKVNLYGDVLSAMTLTVTEPMDVSPYLPPSLLKEAGAQLSGQVRFLALPPFAWVVDRLHLQLGRLGIHGSLRVLGSLLRTGDLALTLPDASAQVRGQVDFLGGKLALEGRASAGGLGPLLARLGLPALARSAEIPRFQVAGTFQRPVLGATAVVLGVPLVPRLETTARYAHAPGGGRLDVQRLLADPFSGSVSGTGALLLGPRPRLVGVRLDASHLDLARLPGLRGLLGGAAELHLEASGPLLRPVGSLALELGDLRLGGKPLGAAEGRLLFDEHRGVVVERLHVGDAAGSLDVHGSLGLEAPRPLDLDVKLADFLLAAVPERDGATRPLGLAGRASAAVHLGGTVDRPTAAGRVGVVGLALWDTLLGSGELTADLLPGGRMHLLGRFFQGKLAVDGTLAVVGGQVDLQARVSFEQLELAELFYETAHRLGADAWISGWIDVRTRPTLVAELHVERLRADLDSGLEQLPLTIQNHGPIVLRYDHAQARATLVEPLRLASPTGELLVEGSASLADVALRLRGDLQLGLLEPYTRAWVARARGSVGVDVAVSGSAAQPVLAGEVEIHDAVLVPRELDAELRIPGGHLELSLSEVKVVGVVFDVDGHKLKLDGSLALADLRPTRIDAHLRGRLAGRLLQMLAPQSITHASGSAELNLVVRGDLARPSVVGGLTIDQPLDLAPRALRRDVTLRSGVIAMSGDRIVIDDKRPLGGSIDEGSFTVRGSAQLSPLRVDASADLYGLVHKIPDMLAVELSANVHAVLENDRLAVSGKIGIIDGRFFQQLHLNRVLQSVVFGERTTVEAVPFWKDAPLLETMALHLEVETKADSFTINNNVGHNVRLAGQVLITGTPPDPHFDGQVTAAPDGTLTIPVLPRARFAVTDGEIVFVASRQVPTETPSVLVHAEAPFLDAAGVEHRVFLELSGNLENLDWNLRTSTGLNKLETISLLSTGRTPDELRAQARGDATRSQSSQSSSTQTAAPGSSSTIAAVSDELIQELTGDFLSSIIQDPLRSLTGFDFTFSLGADSVRVNAHRALGATLDLTGDYEQATTWRRAAGNVSFRAADDLSLNAQLWFFRPPIEAEETQTGFRLQLKYHITIP